MAVEWGSSKQAMVVKCVITTCRAVGSHHRYASCQLALGR